MKPFRSLASVLLLLASPAVGGTVLPVFHPCPVDAPWLGSAEAEHAGHDGHAPQPAPDSGSHDCSCISSCTPGLAFAAPGAPTPVVDPEARPLRSDHPTSDSTLTLAPLRELLPPSTAPPLILG